MGGAGRRGGEGRDGVRLEGSWGTNTGPRRPWQAQRLCYGTVGRPEGESRLCLHEELAEPVSETWRGTCWQLGGERMVGKRNELCI